MSAKTLRLADDLALPIDLATHVTLVAGKRGSGKTNTAKRIVEQAVRAGVPVAILDPADVWHGLRAGRGGKATGGLPVHIFGGRRADLPLEATAGTLLADVVVEQRVSVVMAIREFSGNDRARFVKDFAERLIRTNTQPLLVVAEEAHEVMPQGKTTGQESVSLGAMLRLVTLGRSSGIGMLQVTQRLARLNKTATTQSDVLFAHRTIGPQDRTALEDWIKYHHAGDHRAAFMEQLPALKTGEAWLWAPDFPEDEPVGLRRVVVLECETFNSHATPKVGERRHEPKALAAVDLERLRSKMAATIERAKADDPRELRKQIAQASRDAAASARRIKDLEARLASTSGFSSSNEKAKQEVRVLTDADRALLEQLRQRVAAVEAGLHEASARALERVTTTATKAVNNAAVDFERFLEDSRERFVQLFETKRVQRLLAKLDPVLTPSRIPGTRESTEIPQKGLVAGLTGAARQPRPSPAAGPDAARQELGTSGAYRMLVALSEHAPDRVTLSKLALRTGISRRGGTFRTYLGKLKSLGWVHGNGTGVAVTDAGLDALGEYEPMPTGQALIAYWQRELGESGARRMFDAIVAAYPRALSTDELEAQTGIAARGGTFRTYLGKLRTLDLVTRGEIKASEELFS